MTIQIFTQANAHFFGDAFLEQGRLRKRFCIDNRGWKQRVAHGMEFDEFDTPDAWYMIYRDETGRVWACNRMISTATPYMIEMLWPDMVEEEPVAKTPKIWEQSRFCIDDDLPRERKGEVISELLGGISAFNHAMGIEEVWWMAEPKNVKFISNNVIRLGQNKVVDGKECFVGKSLAGKAEPVKYVAWAPEVEIAA